MLLGEKRWYWSIDRVRHRRWSVHNYGNIGIQNTVAMEHTGFEPVTSTLPVWRAPNCANTPKWKQRGSNPWPPASQASAHPS